MYAHKVRAYTRYDFGDIVSFNGSNYYVISYDTKKLNYVTLLKADELDTDEYTSENNNGLAFYSYGKDEFNCLSSSNSSSCTKNYDETVIKQIVDSWANKNFNDNLIEVDGYKARLLNQDDIYTLSYAPEARLYCENRPLNGYSYDRYGRIYINGVTYYACDGGFDLNDSPSIYTYVCNGGGETIGRIKEILEENSHYSCSTSYVKSRLVPADENMYPWIDYNKTSFWAMESDYHHYDDFNESNYYEIRTYGSYVTYTKYAIRPVVNVKKTAIGNKSVYEIGDKIIYNNEDYYVIHSVSEEDQYVTMLKYVPLTNSQVDDATGHSFYVSYYNGDNCNHLNETSCDSSFENSNVKKILDKWSESFKDDLVTVEDENGQYSVRLLTFDELIDKFYYVTKSGSYYDTFATENTPDYIYNDSKSYWIMSEIENKSIMKVATRHVLERKIYNTALIRPVINVKKCSLNKKDCDIIEQRDDDNPKCEGTPIYGKVMTYKEYNVGDLIEYKGESYHVIRPSGVKDNYIVLLKDNVISNELISKYTDNVYSGMVPFDPSDKCYNNYHYCSNNYDKSFVKTVIDKWVKDIFSENELVNVNGYKARLLLGDELKDYLGFEYKYSSPYVALKNDELGYDWIHENGKDYWLNEYAMDSNYYVDVMSDLGVGKEGYVRSEYYVRPVIHLNKCVLTDSCYETDGVIGCDELPSISEEKVEIVTVDNTLSNVSKIAMILSSLIIIIGLLIYVSTSKNNK